MSKTVRLVPLAQGVHADIVLPEVDGWQDALGAGSDSHDGRRGASSAPPSTAASPPSSTSTVPASQTTQATQTADTVLLERAARRTVLKLVAAPKSGSASSRRPHDVVREIRILERTNHPNIIRLLEHSYDDARIEHSISLPLLATTLTDVLKHETARMHPAQLFLHTTAGIMAALAYLHEASLAHRDVKPANIMYGFDGRPVLIDFATAWDSHKRGDGGGSMSCAVGTGSYRAPELLFSPPRYDPSRIDLWSAGVTLAEFFRPRGGAPGSPSSLRTSDPGSGSGSSGDSTSWNDAHAYSHQPPSHAQDQRQQRPSAPGASAHPTQQAPRPSSPPRASPDGGASSRLAASFTRLQVHDDPQPQGQRQDPDPVPVPEPEPEHEPLTPPTPLFSAAFGELGLAASIFRLLGTPTPESWPSFNSLPDAGKMQFDEHPARRVRDALVFDPARVREQEHALVLDILENLVVLEPARRRTAAATLALIPDTADVAASANRALHPLLIDAARKYVSLA